MNDLFALDRRQLELLAVVFGYIGTYLVVVAPIVESLTGFPQPQMIGGGRRTGLPITGQGWLCIFGAVPVILAYAFVRARLVGAGVREFWNEDGQLRETGPCRLVSGSSPGSGSGPFSAPARTAPARAVAATPFEEILALCARDAVDSRAVRGAPVLTEQ